MRWLLALILFCLPLPISRDPPTQVQKYQLVLPALITWNVGQGLWVTWVDDRTCWHFDMGGEFAPWQALRALCRPRENLVRLSHWDMDHIGFIARAQRRLPNLCLWQKPIGPGSATKRALIAKIKSCIQPGAQAGPQPEHDPAREILSPSHSAARTSNDMSHVYLISHAALLPGDSTSHAEKTWAYSLHNVEFRALILGHHGSRTSTSDLLLNETKRIGLAIASARRSRYGHPHREVVERLKRNSIPVLSTEDWGSLIVETSPPGITEGQRTPTGDRDDIPCSSCARQAHSKQSHRKRSNL